MPVMLRNGHAVHGAKENRHEYQPMVERRAEGERGQKAHGATACRELKKRFHAASLPHLSRIQ